MTTESILTDILLVNVLLLVAASIAAFILLKALRTMYGEQQAVRRLIANQDWSSVLSNLHGQMRESVRILEILDKRLQKLEALEKVQLTQTNPNFRG